MNRLDELDKMLAKLKANLTQMTPQQKVKYERQLKELKNNIWKVAAEILVELAVGGFWFGDHLKDRNDFIVKAGKMVEEMFGDGTISEAISKPLFSEYSLDKFLEAAMFIRSEVEKKHYVEFWLKHCRATGKKRYTHKNDIVGMEWDDKLGLWTDREGSWGVFLPPTNEQILEERNDA